LIQAYKVRSAFWNEVGYEGKRKTPPDMIETPQLQESASTRPRPIAELVGALTFLTRLPVPFARTVNHAPMHAAMRMYAPAGALIGAATGVLLFGLAWVGLPALLAAALTFAISLIVTGALHEDGLADCADGFGGGKHREHRLEIMRDSRIGTYGTLGLFCAGAAKLACFVEFQTMPFWTCVAVIAAAGAFSRALMVDLLWATKPARSDGLSHMVGRPSRNTALISVTIGAFAVLAAGFTFNAVSGVYALPVALVATGAIRSVAMRLIGGQTGDVCGAVQVVSEIAVLGVFASTFR
jgi:adenosylcobinamide-GDP ribazoletransferase